jgi:hypothetical protein
VKKLLKKIKQGNASLYYCGLAHFSLFLLLIIVSQFDHRQLLGVNLWIKPIKFALSISIYCLTWSLFLQYLPLEKAKNRFANFTVFALSFEMVCIASQAGRGQMSHYNVSGTYNFIVFNLMGVFIVMQTIYAFYMGILFFKTKISQIPASLLWGIRLGIITACIFALEGGVMAVRLSHTVGAKDGTMGLPLVNWSRVAGDLRIAHFAGLHSLQIIPLFALLISPNNKKVTITFAVLYFIFISALFYEAALGHSLF